LSTSGSGHAVLFQKPEGNWLLDRVDVFGSRYGEDKPPNKNFTIFICDEDFNTICEINRPYGLFRKGENQWFKLDIEPVDVPRRFYICLSFEPTYTRGVYVAYDKDVEHSHSRSALPYTHVFVVEGKYDWMIRAHLRNKDAK
jgi:RNA polymerase sigma-70 factor (ECF subfamily)